MKNTMRLFVLAISLLSINAVAKINEIESKIIVKKHFVGKPGYNRRIVKVYKRDFIDEINTQIASYPPATGLLSKKYTPEKKESFRQHRMKIRRHP